MRKKADCEDARPWSIDEEEMRKEIEQFNIEKARIKRILDGIDKTKRGALNKVMDIGFVAALVALVAARFLFVWIDDILSLEFGLILLSAKIIWLISVQNSYNHFIFMIMHTIDQHQQHIIEKMNAIAKDLEALPKAKSV